MTPWKHEKAVIAAVQGTVMGGGCELVMLCDLNNRRRQRVFAEPEVRFSSIGPAIVMRRSSAIRKRANCSISVTSAMPRAARGPRDGQPCRAVIRLAREEPRLGEAAVADLARSALHDKLAINAAADAAGFSNRINIGLDVVAPLYATKTELGQRFPRHGGGRRRSRRRPWRSAHVQRIKLAKSSPSPALRERVAEAPPRPGEGTRSARNALTLPRSALGASVYQRRGRGV
jgi:hypothetical protein